jgi:SulP family sulfate permease
MILKPADKGVRLAHYIPILEWDRTYSRQNMSNDLIAVLIVTIMLIPQSLTYAMFAGLRPRLVSMRRLC